MYKLDVLDNGLKVVSRPMGHMESVSIGIWIRAGGRYENRSNSGISHLLEHLLFKGTNKRDMRSIKEAIEGRGGSFNGFTAEEFTCYLVKVLAKDMELGIDILTDMVFDPRLADDELIKEKSVIIEEINMYKDMPSQYVHEMLAELMWPNHPLGLPLAGTVESVMAIARKDIVEYRESFYNPKNMLLIATGRVQESDLMALSKKYIGSRKALTPPMFQSVTIDQKVPRVMLFSKDTEQTHISLGFHSIKRSHPDRFALNVANIILGANMSSRLFHIVRDEMALCYEIGSSIRKFEDSGAFTVSAGVDNKKVTRALEVVMDVLKTVKKEPVTKEELARAKEYYKGQLLFALEDTMSIMLWLGERVIAGEQSFTIQGILDSIERVTQDDIMKVCSNMLKDSNINCAAIGPLKDDKQLKEVLHV